MRVSLALSESTALAGRGLEFILSREYKKPEHLITMVFLYSRYLSSGKPVHATVLESMPGFPELASTISAIMSLRDMGLVESAPSGWIVRLDKLVPENKLLRIAEKQNEGQENSAIRALRRFRELQEQTTGLTVKASTDFRMMRHWCRRMGADALVNGIKTYFSKGIQSTYRPGVVGFNKYLSDLFSTKS
jgi:hypothetical protein